MVADRARRGTCGLGRWPLVSRPARYWPTSIVFSATRAASRSSVSFRYSRRSIERGGRLGADDDVAVADGVAQDSQIGQGEVAGVVEVAGHQRGHPAAALALGDVHIDARVLEQGDDRFGEFLVEMVGIHVDEIRHARAGRLGFGASPGRAARRASRTGCDGPSGACGGGKGRRIARRATAPRGSPSGRCKRSGTDWRASTSPRRARGRNWWSSGRAARRRRPWPPASAPRRPRPPGTPTGRGCSGRRGRQPPGRPRSPRASGR